MKNKVDRKLAETWLGKSLIWVRQKVDDVWMGVGQYLVRNWSAFKTNKVGQNLDESWMDFGRKMVQQGYNDGTTFFDKRICQGYANDMPEFRSNRLLQPYSSITPKTGMQWLLQFFSNTSPEIEGSSHKWLSQQLPSGYPENEGFSLDKSGQNEDEIGIENCVKVSVWFRQFGGYQVGQFLGETGVDLGRFYPVMNPVIQPLSYIAHSFIVHNKRVPSGYTKVTPSLHQEFSLFDIASLFLYVVLPDQSL